VTAWTREAPQIALPDRPNDSPRLFFLSAIAFVCGTTGLFAAACEWGHYGAQIAPVGIEPAWGDRVVIFWLLWWKSLALCLPWLVAAGVLAWRRRLRGATSLLLVGCLGVLFWLAADLRVQQFSGNHAADFLPYLYDAAGSSAGANHIQWGGGAGAMVLAVGLTLAIVVASGSTLWLACRVAIGWGARRWPFLAHPAGCWTAAAGLATLLIGLVPGQGLATHPLLLRAVKVHLPVSVTALDRLSSWTLASIGLSHSAQKVFIVSLLANPAGPDAGHEEVHLHNFSTDDVCLDGWRLENGRGEQYALDGAIAPDDTRVIVIPDDTMRLRNQGDRVRLLDGGQHEIHQVSYGPQQAKYGRLLHFRSAASYDNFEQRVNASAQAEYAELWPRLAAAKPADESAAFHRADAPNVVLLVAESLRHDAIGPETMSRLDAWGRHGLRLRRHYAGSNSSHLGLYALLYGRSPLTYDVTLDARVLPQLPLSLRRSGYETIFLTAGDCRGFRRMGEYLSEDAFDHVILDGGQSWRDWPQCDSRVLARVRRLATEPGTKPRFIMAFLMSTHFPYACPGDLAVRQPCGEGIDLSNWKRESPEVLRNRYLNAAAFLEGQIVQTLEALDPRRNLVIVTGDHGESLGEDGGLAHGSRGSEIQMRVPFVMVGPGVPTTIMGGLTTHMDLLPTLLHVLAARKVEIAHAHGRDLLSDPPARAVLLAPYRWQEPLDLVLIRGEEGTGSQRAFERLHFNYRLSAPEINTFGFCDEACHLDLTSSHDCSPQAAAAWAETLREELSRVAW
jgi:hypothetical protein